MPNLIVVQKDSPLETMGDLKNFIGECLDSEGFMVKNERIYRREMDVKEDNEVVKQVHPILVERWYENADGRLLGLYATDYVKLTTAAGSPLHTLLYCTIKLEEYLGLLAAEIEKHGLNKYVIPDNDPKFLTLWSLMRGITEKEKSPKLTAMINYMTWKDKTKPR